MSPGNLEELAGFAESLTADVIRFAVDEANANGAPRWAYVAAILRGYLRDGIKTVGDARAAKVRREAGQAKVGRNPLNNPALNYDQREYRDEDFGDNFFLDVVAEYGDTGGKNDA
jgi:DnaD/phage-associated family protein